MPRKKKVRDISISPILETLWAGWGAQALIAAIELDLFSHIDEGRRTVGEIAAAAHATPRGVRCLLDALVPLGLIGKRADRYKLRPAAAFLVKGHETSLPTLASLVQAEWTDWGRLGNVVRSGRPVSTGQGPGIGGGSDMRGTESLFVLHQEIASYMVQTLPAKLLGRAASILDLGCSSAAWSIPFARALPDVRVTTVDSAPALKIAEKATAKLGLASRYAFLAGSPQKAEFGQGVFDLVILPYVLHHLNRVEAEALVCKCGAALKPQGTLLIAEYLPNDVRTGPLIPMLFGLNLLLHNREGDVYTFRQIVAWLKSASLRNPRALRLAGFSSLVLGTR